MQVTMLRCFTAENCAQFTPLPCIGLNRILDRNQWAGVALWHGSEWCGVCLRDIAVYISSDDYRQKAAECEQIAARAHFARIAARYRDLARRWRDMAQQAERLERIADAYNMPIGADRQKTRSRTSPAESESEPATDVVAGNTQMIDEQIEL